MTFDHYGLQVSLRVAFLFAALLGLAFAIAYAWPYTLQVILALLAVVLTWSLLRYTNKVVRDLSTFLKGFRYGDFQQKLAIDDLGNNFGDLEQVLQQTAAQLQEQRLQKEKQAVYLQTLIQHLPLPFLVLHLDGRAEIMNMASRRVFNVADIATSDDLARFGAAFQRDVLQIRAGESLLSTVRIEGSEEHYILTATSISMEGDKQKLVALLNIQGELDATELATWQNLLRVTSHEILNSLAPVSSCAQTAESLVRELLENDRPDRDEDSSERRSDLQDICDAVDTIARRSEGLMRFVRSYRQLTRMPPPKPGKIVIADFFRRLDSLLSAELRQKDIALNFSAGPHGLMVLADADMLDQAMINLVRNAADAVRNAEPGRIDIRAYVDGKQRVVLEVADNGPGIDAADAVNIFVPFYTTKEQGSGVGLALVRYIMLSHGGAARFLPGPQGGSVFRLLF